jgi:fermentation-respiration switch protein FrsA (DUF1100 family)
MSNRTDVTIPSEGETLAAWLYRPDQATGSVPCIVMAHGFSATRHEGLAQDDPEIAAVVAQAPFTDGLAIVKVTPKGNLLRATADALRDQAGALLGRPPVMLTAAGEPGSYAAMTAPEALPGFKSIATPGSPWRNEVAARVMLHLGTQNPAGGVGKLQMPLLICACDKDETTPPQTAVKAAERAPKGELKRYPLGHFDIYHDEQARADQVEFLSRHLLGVAATATRA